MKENQENMLPNDHNHSKIVTQGNFSDEPQQLCSVYIKLNSNPEICKIKVEKGEKQALIKS